MACTLFWYIRRGCKSQTLELFCYNVTWFTTIALRYTQCDVLRLGTEIVVYTTGNTNWKERPSTGDLLILTSLDQLVLILQTFFTFLTKWATLMRRSTVLSLPLQLVFPVHIESLGDIGYLHDFTTVLVYLIFKVSIKILFVVHLKHSSFWPSVDLNPCRMM